MGIACDADFEVAAVDLASFAFCSCLIFIFSSGTFVSLVVEMLAGESLSAASFASTDDRSINFFNRFLRRFFPSGVLSYTKKSERFEIVGSNLLLVPNILTSDNDMDFFLRPLTLRCSNFFCNNARELLLIVPGLPLI